MANAFNIPDQDAIVVEIFISAQLEKVFQALIDPDHVLRWWGQTGVYRCTRFHNDPRPGGKWRSEGIGPDGGNFHVSGEYLEIDPPHLLVHTWIASWTGAAQTVVRWELQSVSNGTLLRLRHNGLAAHPELAQSYRGWPRMLGWIKALLETGETVETRASA